MKLEYHFKPGLEQSQHAHLYFESLAAELVGQWLNELHPVQYLFEESGYPSLAVRLWAAGDHRTLRGLVPWIRQVLVNVRKLSGKFRNLDQLVAPLMACGHSGSAWFIEVLDPNAAFSSTENNILCLGLAGDVTVFLSGKNLLYVQLDEGLFGMVVQGQGSWLIEDVQHEQRSTCHTVGLRH